MVGWMDCGRCGASCAIGETRCAMAEQLEIAACEPAGHFRVSCFSVDQQVQPPKFARRGYWLEICLGLSLIALIAQLWPDAMRIWREWPRPGQQAPARTSLSLPGGIETEVRFLLYLPADYSSKQRWPLLLFLHGSGERGDDLERVSRFGPPRFLAGGIQLPMVVVSPQCRSDDDWHNDQLLELLDYVEKKFSIDPTRVYLAGYSMGGYGTWSLAAVAPDRFAAIVPVSGGGNPSDGSKLSKLPIWAFHGAIDTVVPITEDQKMVEAVRAAGGKPRITIYPDRGHDTCNITFERDDLYDWLLQQRRPR